MLLRVGVGGGGEGGGERGREAGREMVAAFLNTFSPFLEGGWSVLSLIAIFTHLPRSISNEVAAHSIKAKKNKKKKGKGT